MPETQHDKNMKLVILDGYTVVKDDLSWSALTNLVEITEYSHTEANQVVERCKGHDMILTNKVVISASIMEQLSDLKYVGVLATGYNVVDTQYAKKRNIVVTNIPAYSTDSVAQMVWAHILNIFSNVDYYARSNHNGRWSANSDFCYWDTPFHELAGKTLGIVGLGNIGMKVARIGLAFGMHIEAVTSKNPATLTDIECVSFEKMMQDSDIVSLHCPLTDSNKGMINHGTLSLMKKGAILINTGRGGLVVETDVVNALQSGQLKAYGADVLATEPPTADNPLLQVPNCYLTPHIAWATVEARQRLIDICTENVKAFLNGAPVNQVNL